MASTTPFSKSASAAWRLALAALLFAFQSLVLAPARARRRHHARPRERRARPRRLPPRRGVRHPVQPAPRGGGEPRRGAATSSSSSSSPSRAGTGSTRSPSSSRQTYKITYTPLLRQYRLSVRQRLPELQPLRRGRAARCRACAAGRSPKAAPFASRTSTRPPSACGSTRRSCPNPSNSTRSPRATGTSPRIGIGGPSIHEAVDFPVRGDGRRPRLPDVAGLVEHRALHPELPRAPRPRRPAVAGPDAAHRLPAGGPAAKAQGARVRLQAHAAPHGRVRAHGPRARRPGVRDLVPVPAELDRVVVRRAHGQGARGRPQPRAQHARQLAARARAEGRGHGAVARHGAGRRAGDPEPPARAVRRRGSHALQPARQGDRLRGNRGHVAAARPARPERAAPGSRPAAGAHHRVDPRARALSCA